MNLDLTQLNFELKKFDWSVVVPSGEAWCGIERDYVLFLKGSAEGKQNIQTLNDEFHEYESRQCLHCLGNEKLKEYSSETISNFFSSMGKIRSKPLIVKYVDDIDTVYCSPELISSQLETIGRILRDLPLAPKIANAWLAYLMFVRTHPFSDGNGRSARLLASFVLRDLYETKNCVFPIGPLMRQRKADLLPKFNSISNEFDLALALEAVHRVFVASVHWRCQESQPRLVPTTFRI